LIVHQTLQPEGWVRPRGYANGIAAQGRLVFTAGIIGWDQNENFVATDLVGQFRQVLINTIAVLKEAGAGPEHVVRMTWYLTDRNEYIARGSEIGRIYREFMGKAFPAMAVVEVSALVEAEAKVEIETIAVIPESSGV